MVTKRIFVLQTLTLLVLLYFFLLYTIKMFCSQMSGKNAKTTTDQLFFFLLKAFVTYFDIFFEKNCDEKVR